MITKPTSFHWRQEKESVACSICSATLTIGVRSSTAAVKQHDTSHYHAPTRNSQLDASFVNIPHSHYPSTYHTTNNTANNVNDDIESNNALLSSDQDETKREVISGSVMQNACNRLDVYLQAALEILSDEPGMDGVNHQKKFYCQSCLDRIGQAIDTCSERLDEECMAYDKAISLEEERTDMLTKALSSTNDDTGLDLMNTKDNDDDDKEDAILRAMESFQNEIDTLTNACTEQENELRMLQSLMKNQIERSINISNNEDIVHNELNSLEIDANNFGEESHIVRNSCSAVEDEIGAISRVKLMSIPFNIQVNTLDSNTSTNQEGGCYPTINNLRLAYRINKKAGLHRDEINASFSYAAQLVAFTLGLYPSIITSTIRIIPIHPCAKILVNLPEGGSVYNLGFDTTVGDDNQQPNSVPTRSITLFLVLLSQLSSHIMTETKTTTEPPPFEMTETSIDNVDLTRLSDSDTQSWSSVVYCLAANLKWLSELGLDNK